MSFDGKVIVVTGAGSGLGTELVRAFASRRARVVVADIDGERAARVAADVRAAGLEAMAVEADVSDGDQVRRMAAEVSAGWGSVSVLVNNAAAAHDHDILTGPEEAWDQDISVSLRSAYLCSRAFLPAMIQIGRRETSGGRSDEQRLGPRPLGQRAHRRIVRRSGEPPGRVEHVGEQL